MALSTVFVTVGTTQFDRLINIIVSKSILKILRTKGCRELIIQIGQGKIPQIEDYCDIDIKIFRIKESIENEILNADLIIGHAGAGTCLQSLHAGKRLVVVVNEELMDNHQMELAERLSDEGYIHVTFCSELENFLKLDVLGMNLKSYPSGDAQQYVNFIDNMMGFVS